MIYKLDLDVNKCHSLDYCYKDPCIIQACLYKKIGYNRIEQLSYFSICREIIVDSLITYIKQVDKNRLRLLLSANVNAKITKKDVENIIKLGIKMTNIVNNEYGIQPIISQVLKIDAPYPIIELSASRKWQRSPQMLSLFLLFIKYCNNKYFSKINTYKELMDVINNNIFIAKNLGITSKEISKVLNNYNILFKNLPMKENYKSKSYRNRHSVEIQYEGITCLCDNTSQHKILSKRFANLLPDE